MSFLHDAERSIIISAKCSKMKLLYVVVAGEALFLGGVTFGIGYTCFKYNYFAGSAFLATTFLGLHYFFRKYMFSTFGIGPSPIFPDLLIRDPKQKVTKFLIFSSCNFYRFKP